MTLLLDYRQQNVNDQVGQHDDVDEDVDEIVELRQLYNQHGAQVYRFCLRTLPSHLAEETTQDVFVRAWQHRDRYDPTRGSVLAWLIGIAKNRIIDIARAEHRHSTRRAELALDETSMTPTIGASIEEVENLASRLLIADALRQLPSRQRQAVYLSYVEGKTHQEIADETGEALGTVKSDIRRGIQSMRRGMEDPHVP